MLTVVTGVQYVTAGSRCATTRRLAGSRPRVPCAARSSPSAPSCCSARSSTPTRRGSASSSRCTASSTCARRRSATTTTASSTRSARRLDRADAVIVCGGLGPTQDDITREAIAEVMGVAARAPRRAGRRHPRAVRVPRAARCRRTTCARPTCPRGATVDRAAHRHRARARSARSATRSSTPCRACRTRCGRCSSGPCCPTSPRRAGVRVSIVSRTLRTWGESESRRRRAARRPGSTRSTRPATPRSRSSPAASRASRCASPPGPAPTEEAEALLDAEEAEVRAVLGTIVFSGADESMEAVVGRLLAGARAARWPSPSRSPAAWWPSRLVDDRRGQRVVPRRRRRLRPAR